MVEMTHLYILIFPERGIIKVGKADEIHARIQSLKRWWGEADYEASYSLFAPTKLIFRLEKSLLFLLSEYAVNFAEGDGRTELFSSEALGVVLKHIELFCDSGAVTEPLKKGVFLPPPVFSLRRPRGMHLRYQKKNASLVTGATRIAEKFGRINRLLIMLLRRQSRLAYQYDIIDGYVYFRFRLPSSVAEYASTAAMQLLSFDIEDFNGWYGTNHCSATYSDGVLQYNVRLMSADRMGSQESLFYYFSRQSEHLLAKLPKRSAAAKEEIPMVDDLPFPQWKY